jgi:pimeloyl-ACP methyl ester carboxylesterase
MPVFKRDDAEIYYEVHGKGFPLLLFAPGGLRSQLVNWRQSLADPTKPPAWMDPMTALADHFTVVGMDQRNAGASHGRVRASDGWHTYAGDHLALMDHLGFSKFHVMGGCIGGSYCLTLCEMAPERVGAAVLQNPIGLHENRDTWEAAVSNFQEKMLSEDGSLAPGIIQSFGRNMFGGEFVFSVGRDFVRNCGTPLYLQPGIDKPHPAQTSAEIAALAPNIEVQTDWRAPDHLDESIRRVRAFLLRNTPA